MIAGASGERTQGCSPGQCHLRCNYHVSLLLKVLDCIKLKIMEVPYSTFLKTYEVVNNDILKVCKPVAQKVCANVEVAVPR